MSQSSPSNPNVTKSSDPNQDDFLSVDQVRRWRENVESFAQTTQTMLESIQSEISSGFAKGQVAPRSSSVRRTTTQDAPPTAMNFAIPKQNLEPIQTTATKQATTANHTVSDSQAIDAITSATTDQCDVLLARLKQQLAEQLAD